MESIQLQSRQKSQNDIFAWRLKLLVEMAKNCLDDGEISSRRRRIMLENARYIELESMELGHLNQDLLSNLNEKSSVFIDDCFYRCAYDLAIQIKSLAKGTPMDNAQKSILKEILETLRVIWSTDIWKQRLKGLPRRLPSNIEFDNCESFCADSPAPIIVH